MSEILRYQPVHEDAMVCEADGAYVKWDTMDEELRKLRGLMNDKHVALIDRLIDGVAQRVYMDRAQVLRMFNEIAMASRKTEGA